MRIGLDLTHTLAPQLSGTSLYALALAEALAGRPEVEVVGCYRLSAWRKRGRLAEIHAPLQRRFYFDRFAPSLARGLDLFHGLESRAARFGPARQVVTLHDVVHLWMPGFVDAPGSERRRRDYARVRKVDAIVTPSEFERRNVIAHLGVPPERVHAIPLAPAPRFLARQEPDAAVLARHGLNGPYVLFVGVAQPRKNLLTLLRALERGPEALHLAVAGPILPSHLPELAPMLERLGSRVHLLGYVDNAELPSLYSGAVCTAIPSRYESFGIPALEAMACGSPLIASRAGALEEIGGNAARYFDPNADEAAEALAGLLTSLWRSDSERQSMRRAGMERAAQFSYAKTAARTVELYRRVLAS